MKIRIINLLLVFFLLVACDSREKKPLVDTVGQPEPVYNVNVENEPGAATIFYSLRDDPSILYVMAEYTSGGNNEFRRVKSSIFKNYVKLEGFGEEGSYDIELYTVSRSEKKSEPVNVTVNPERPLVHYLFDSMTVAATFGGINIEFENEEEIENVIHVAYKDSVGAWTDYDQHFSSNKSVQYTVRGFEPKSTEFAIHITDKWRNSSDTLLIELTPLYEEELDKSLWKDMDLIDDFNEGQYSTWGLPNLWMPGPKAFFYQNPAKAEVLPNWVTIDLGKNYFFGRMKLNQLSHSNAWKYGKCSPHLFQIHGSNEPTTNWDDWTLLGDFESIKPSGLPVGQLSEEDLRLNDVGEDFNFIIKNESYRYIRFKTLETWGNVKYMCALELTLWGQVDE